MLGRYSKIASAALAIAVLASLSVRAEEEPYDSQLVETATVRAEPLGNATASVTVIDRETIDALEVATVGELVRYAAGLDLVGTGMRAGTAWAQIRGGDPNMTVVMIDGVPINDQTDQVGGGIVDLNSLSLHHVERIEVARGPLSFFYGSSGLAGAINVITRDADADGRQIGYELGAGTASMFTGAASLASRRENRRYYLGLSWDEESERIANDRFEQQTLSASARFGTSESTELRLTGRIATRETDDYPDASGGPVFGDGALRLSDHTEVAVGMELQAGGVSGGPRHALRLSVLRHELDRSSPAIGFSVPPSVEETTFSNIEAGWNVPLVDGDRNRLSVGVDLQHERGDNRSTLSLPPAFGGDVDGSYDLERTTTGAYVDYRHSTRTVDLDLGLRVDDPEDGDTEVNPRFGLSIRSEDAPVRLRVSASRGFKLPGFFAQASPPQLGGNPALEPERSRGFDAAVEWATDDVRGSVGIFKTRYEDLIDFDFPTFSFVNRSRVKSEGIEATLHWQAGERWTFQASLTRQDVEGPSDDVQLRHRPELFGAARASWQLSDAIRWTVDVQSVSDRFDQQLPVPTRTSVAGYGVAGTTLTFDVAPGWTVWTRIDNVFDNEYETFIGFPGAETSVRVGVRRRAG